ncbi:S-type pyocin domain-containing protein [Pseudomonas protegens]|uniref:S-type pyocin domain-containing protein n=1 Tax=Pseudomonas protegens TaxID=380021 RepID=UPI0035C062F3
MPVRISSKTAEDGRSEVFVVKTDGVTIPSKVKVIAATYNAGQNVYTATTADVPPRTLTWTPIVSPGNSSTTSPAQQPLPPVYTGATAHCFAREQFDDVTSSTAATTRLYWCDGNTCSRTD